MIQRFKDFLKLEAASSIVLIAAAVLAMIAANTPLRDVYAVLQSPTATLIVNDGLMAVFFLLIGIELKSEIKEGALSERGQALLPVAAAFGGVIAPALIYGYFNWGLPSMRGWAIASATDIAFSLGVLAIFGRRLPAGLRVFLMAVAVIDDLLAVIIIAAFYTHELYYPSLAAAAGCALLLYLYNRRGVTRLLPYLFAGAALWVATFDSGVHPTVAGVALGMLMPPAQGGRVAKMIHGPVAFGIVPFFAFANAGIALSGLNIAHLAENIPKGIALGLFAGKQFGIFLASWLLVRCGLAKLPERATWLQFYAVCMIAGIGFTMSLFIGALAFTDTQSLLYTRLGVIMGSLASAFFGTLLLALALARGRDS